MYESARVCVDLHVLFCSPVCRPSWVRGRLACVSRMCVRVGDQGVCLHPGDSVCLCFASVCVHTHG